MKTPTTCCRQHHAAVTTLCAGRFEIIITPTGTLSSHASSLYPSYITIVQVEAAIIRIYHFYLAINCHVCPADSDCSETPTCHISTDSKPQLTSRVGGHSRVLSHWPMAACQARPFQSEWNLIIDTVPDTGRSQSRGESHNSGYGRLTTNRFCHFGIWDICMQGLRLYIMNFLRK